MALPSSQIQLFSMLPIVKNTSATRSRAARPPKTQKQKSRPFDMGGNKIYFISLGCPRNLVDSEVMLGILLRSGYEVAEQMQEADYLIINTCGFLEVSRQESKDRIREAIEHSKPHARVIVTGCMVQTHRDQLKEEMPEIDYFLGSGDVEAILEAVQATQKGEVVSSARSYLEAGEVPRRLSTPPHYAYLKIAEGCRKRCAYCIIPTIKGPLRSKTQEQILKEFRLLLSQGVKEIILIAQDLGDYAKDQGAKGSSGLVALLQTLLQEPGSFWLRLLYLYPDEITPELIALMKQDSRLCPYLDMPIQHVNPVMLQSMRRTTSKEQIVEIVQLLRQEIPDVSIRTSLIVGFPGETEEQFQELLAFVRTYHLEQVGIFPFSREEGSSAFHLPDQVPEEVKQDRYARLVKEQQKVLKKELKKKIGAKMVVIVEGYHPDSPLLMRGRHRGQCPDIDGQVIINDGRKVTAFGQPYLVEITDVAGYDLLGRVVAPCSF